MYGVTPPPFVLKVYTVLFIYLMVLGVILEASLQEIFVVAVRNEDTIRGFYVGFFSI